MPLRLCLLVLVLVPIMFGARTLFRFKAIVSIQCGTGCAGTSPTRHASLSWPGAHGTLRGIHGTDGENLGCFFVAKPVGRSVVRSASEVL